LADGSSKSPGKSPVWHYPHKIGETDYDDEILEIYLKEGRKGFGSAQRRSYGCTGVAV